MWTSLSLLLLAASPACHPDGGPGGSSLQAIADVTTFPVFSPEATWSGDATATFRRIYADVRNGRNLLPPESSEYVYLTVNGLLGNRLPGTFQANIDRLRKLGLETRRVPVNTEASVLENARVICNTSKEIHASTGRRLVFLTHSKGGDDLTAALTTVCPDLAPAVRAVVAMETPYFGTPVADEVAGWRPTDAVATWLATKVFHGDRATYADLTTPVRATFVNAHPYPAAIIPTVSLEGSIDSWASEMKPLEALESHAHGLATDGLVPASSSAIPGSMVVHLTNIDHAEPALPVPPGMRRWDRGDLTEALLTLVLTRTVRPPPPR